jgi:hypothetical protein
MEISCTTNSNAGYVLHHIVFVVSGALPLRNSHMKRSSFAYRPPTMIYPQLDQLRSHTYWAHQTLCFTPNRSASWKLRIIYRKPSWVSNRREHICMPERQCHLIKCTHKLNDYSLESIIYASTSELCEFIRRKNDVSWLQRALRNAWEHLIARVDISIFPDDLYGLLQTCIRWNILMANSITNSTRYCTFLNALSKYVSGKVGQIWVISPAARDATLAYSTPRLDGRERLMLRHFLALRREQMKTVRSQWV